MPRVTPHCSLRFGWTRRPLASTQVDESSLSKQREGKNNEAFGGRRVNRKSVTTRHNNKGILCGAVPLFRCIPRCLCLRKNHGIVLDARSTRCVSKGHHKLGTIVLQEQDDLFVVAVSVCKCSASVVLSIRFRDDEFVVERPNQETESPTILSMDFVIVFFPNNDESLVS